jgi:hypothetical protein
MGVRLVLINSEIILSYKFFLFQIQGLKQKQETFFQ